MNIATYQARPEIHGNGTFFFTDCGHNMYSIKDNMTYHGCLCRTVYGETDFEDNQSMQEPLRKLYEYEELENKKQNDEIVTLKD